MQVEVAFDGHYKGQSKATIAAVAKRTAKAAVAGAGARHRGPAQGSLVIAPGERRHMTEPVRLTESEMQREIDRKMALPGMVEVIAIRPPALH